MNNQISQRPTQTIAILQYNLNRNQDTTHSVLNNSSSSKYTVLMLQEQHIFMNTNSSPIHHSWTLIEAKAMENHPPQAAIYLNKTILPAHSYETIHMEIPNIVAVALQLDRAQHPTLIINIYNTKNTTQPKEL